MGNSNSVEFLSRYRDVESQNWWDSAPHVSTFMSASTAVCKESGSPFTLLHISAHGDLVLTALQSIGLIRHPSFPRLIHDASGTQLIIAVEERMVPVSFALAHKSSLNLSPSRCLCGAVSVATALHWLHTVPSLSHGCIDICNVFVRIGPSNANLRLALQWCLLPLAARHLHHGATSSDAGSDHTDNWAAAIRGDSLGPSHLAPLAQRGLLPGFLALFGGPEDFDRHCFAVFIFALLHVSWLQDVSQEDLPDTDINTLSSLVDSIAIAVSQSRGNTGLHNSTSQRPAAPRSMAPSPPHFPVAFLPDVPAICRYGNGLVEAVNSTLVAATPPGAAAEPLVLPLSGTMSPTSFDTVTISSLLPSRPIAGVSPGEYATAMALWRWACKVLVSYGHGRLRHVDDSFASAPSLLNLLDSPAINLVKGAELVKSGRPEAPRCASVISPQKDAAETVAKLTSAVAAVRQLELSHDVKFALSKLHVELWTHDSLKNCGVFLFSDRKALLESAAVVDASPPGRIVSTPPPSEPPGRNVLTPPPSELRKSPEGRKSPENLTRAAASLSTSRKSPGELSPPHLIRSSFSDLPVHARVSDSSPASPLPDPESGDELPAAVVARPSVARSTTSNSLQKSTDSRSSSTKPDSPPPIHPLHLITAATNIDPLLAFQSLTEHSFLFDNAASRPILAASFALRSLCSTDLIRLVAPYVLSMGWLSRRIEPPCDFTLLLYTILTPIPVGVIPLAQWRRTILPQYCQALIDVDAESRIALTAIADIVVPAMTTASLLLHPVQMVAKGLHVRSSRDDAVESSARASLQRSEDKPPPPSFVLEMLRGLRDVDDVLVWHHVRPLQVAILVLCERLQRSFAGKQPLPSSHPLSWFSREERVASSLSSCSGEETEDIPAKQVENSESSSTPSSNHGAYEPNRYREHPKPIRFVDHDQLADTADAPRRNDRPSGVSVTPVYRHVTAVALRKLTQTVLMQMWCHVAFVGGGETGSVETVANNIYWRRCVRCDCVRSLLSFFAIHPSIDPDIVLSAAAIATDPRGDAELQRVAFDALGRALRTAAEIFSTHQRDHPVVQLIPQWAQAGFCQLAAHRAHGAASSFSDLAVGVWRDATALFSKCRGIPPPDVTLPSSIVADHEWQTVARALTPSPQCLSQLPREFAFERAPVPGPRRRA